MGIFPVYPGWDSTITIKFTTILKENTVIMHKGLQIKKNLCLYFPGVSDKILYNRLRSLMFRRLYADCLTKCIKQFRLGIAIN